MPYAVNQEVFRAFQLDSGAENRPRSLTEIAERWAGVPEPAPGPGQVAGGGPGRARVHADVALLRFRVDLEPAAGPGLSVPDIDRIPEDDRAGITSG
ncbi:MAG: hypothetical protein MZU84_05710 [Sphingobacterium sp.]|nr:hypothetical protein [Sphingobacterium sp.]